MDLLIRFTNHLNSSPNNLSKKTVKNYRADLNSFFNWYKNLYNLELRFALSSVTSQIVESYKKSKIEDSNLSASSLKRHLSSLRKFFQFLKTEGTILEDPFEQMKMLQKTNLALNDKWHLLKFKNYLYLHNKSSLTIKNYILDARHFLTWLEQVTKEENILNNISAQTVNEYKNRLLEYKFSPRTINRKLSSIRKYLNWTIKEGSRKSELRSPASEMLPQDKKISQLGSKPNETIAGLTKSTFVLRRYSRFPPLRLIQKTFRGIGLLFDISLIIPLIKLTEALRKSKLTFNEDMLNLTPKPYDVTQPQPRLTWPSIPHISAIPKEFYAPLSISTRYYPLHKKALHFMRYQRPKWYRKYHAHSIMHYFHLAILILFSSFLGFLAYQYLTQSIQEQKSVLGTFQTYSPRILSFKGKLTDFSNNAIAVSDSPVRMSIYNDETATGSSLLWQEVVEINTDSEGRFSAILGNNTFLPQNLFTENQALWLGVSVGDSPELIPREPLAGINLATNAQRLQGLNLITNPNSDTKNVILALDSSGNLTIDGDAEPTFQATGGKFKLMGETLVLSTTPGSNSNVEIAPMDLGKIDLQKPIYNSTENNNMENAIGAVEINDSLAVLATSSATSAFTINQTATGQLISAYKGATAKFAVDNNGNIISQEGIKWQPFNDSKSALNIADATGDAFVTFDSSNSRVGIGTTTPTSTLHVNGSNAEIVLSSGQNDNVFARWLQNTTERGAVFFQNSDSTFHVRSASALSLDTDNSNTPKVYIATSGNVGIGTVSPLFKLDVQDSQPSSAAAQIFNTSSGSDADGLIIKLGTLATSVDNTNHFLSFETAGIGMVGSVRGSGTAGVDFVTTGIADFAEYLKKDENQDIEYGSLVCIDDLGLVLPCDQNNNKIVGIASNHGGFTGGIDLGKSSIRVGFVGQVYTKVSTMNGNIKPGDPLSSSSIPGIAVKAISPGHIVGKAMEALTCTLSTTNENTNNHEQVSGTSCTGKVLVVLSVSWYDPSIYISKSGNILTEKSENPKTSSIVSPIPEVDKIHTRIISPLASVAPIDVQTPLEDIALEVQNASGSAKSNLVATAFDGTSNVPVAFDSDAVAAVVNSLENASFSGTLDTNASSSAIIHNSEFMIPNSNFEDLIAFGPTSLADTSITGLLSIGSTILQDNSINTIGTVLELQPLRQGALSLMGGLVYIDTDGNLKVDGNAQFAKNVSIGGDLVASGSGTFSKLNLSIAKNAFALSSKEIIATGSAGTAFVRAREAEITINNNLVTDKSLIYITLIGTPSGQTPFLLRQQPDKSFTVGIASKSATTTPFNWLIIN